jgi:mannosyl-oligosaccharide alpha-1,2-mannosidase
MLCHSFTVLVTLLSVFPAIFAGQVQVPGLTVPPSASANKDTVKQIFVNSYKAYRTYAFGHDDLTPVSKGFEDGRNGWGASIADAMGTMYIMGLYVRDNGNHTRLYNSWCN